MHEKKVTIQSLTDSRLVASTMDSQMGVILFKQYLSALDAHDN